jgi:hypothetical protein
MVDSYPDGHYAAFCCEWEAIEAESLKLAKKGWPAV